MKRKRLSPEGAVFAWNSIYPVGTPVDLKKDNGEVVRTKTRSGAEVLSGHTAVIWLEGVSGCYRLDRVKAAKEGRIKARLKRLNEKSGDMVLSVRDRLL